MEITNAIFCQRIKKEQDILVSPILTLVTNKLSAIKNIGLLLWVSFLGGEFNRKYAIAVETSSDVMGVIDNSEFSYIWDNHEATICTVFHLNFTPIVFGIHTFTLSTNGSKHSTKILVEKG